MSDRAGDDIRGRLLALSARLDHSLEGARTWVEPASPPRISARGAQTASPHEAPAQLHAELEQARATAELQVQRCAALEDRVAELGAALVGAQKLRTQAIAEAETAAAETSRVLDELESERSAGSERSAPVDPGFGEAFQAKLLENDRLRNERDNLRRSLDEWRKQAREFRRQRDDATLANERLESKCEELRVRGQTSQERLAELQRTVSTQARDLEVAERRTRHLREHIVT